MTRAPLQPALDAARRVLATAGVPATDAVLLLADLLGESRGRVEAMALAGVEVDTDVLREFARRAERRADREPLQHITGRAPFRRLELAVGPGAFVPRPETEVLVEAVLPALRGASDDALAVDLGTGSGAIAVALATEVPSATVIGVDVSPDALIWARRNATGVGNLTIVEADLADALPERGGRAAVVVSNPPYIPEGAVPREPEVRLHDPALALYGGPDGLDVVRAVIRTAARLLGPGGLVAIEHGELQGAAVRALLPTPAWSDARTLPDLTGRDRVTTAVFTRARG